ncbi:MAG: hypothetical protein LBB22_01490 [Treponema sp.]|nr:hypothetical protein [Treponema sp.]
MEFAPQRAALLTANSSLRLFTASSGIVLLTANSGRVEAAGGFSPLENSLPVYTAAYTVPLLVIGEV